ncbi:MAG: type II toxin-antitoxin system YoeB family toxin [Alphaproteobacteria bacterium]|nr:type II toxin-antitoxin system YoeB family toxin [Alphaproteobacteria bacterium]
MCEYIVDNFDNFECLSPEIKEIVAEKQTSEPSLGTEDNPNSTLINSSIKETTVEQENNDQRIDTDLAALSLSPKNPEVKTALSSSPSLTPSSRIHLKPKTKTRKTLNKRQELLKKIISTKAQKITESPVEYTICFASEDVKKDFERYKSDPNFKEVFEEVVKAIKAGPSGYKDPRGRPKLLSGNYAGCLSRHLSKKNRIIYRYKSNKKVMITEVGGHYQRSR